LQSSRVVALQSQASLAEHARDSGLALNRLPGNSAKLRLTLELAALARAASPLRALDIGCAGPAPLNPWEPLMPLRDRLRLTDVDVANLEQVEATARELGLEIELRQANATERSHAFGTATFDAVVSTQVLEHLLDWRGALAEMRNVLRPGGTLLVTCDSGDFRGGPVRRAHLAGKRAYDTLRRQLPAVGRATYQFLSGEWERGPTSRKLRESLEALGLEIGRLERYCLHDVKAAQRHAGPRTRQLGLPRGDAHRGDA
jgi:SAM-dependent methyltransferase